MALKPQPASDAGAVGTSGRACATLPYLSCRTGGADDKYLRSFLGYAALCSSTARRSSSPKRRDRHWPSGDGRDEKKKVVAAGRDVD